MIIYLTKNEYINNTGNRGVLGLDNYSILNRLKNYKENLSKL